MPSSENNRGDFIKIASAVVASGSIASTGPADRGEAPKVLNRGPSMNYRRLGKTEFMLLEIALGGHGAPGYDDRAIQNRMPVLVRAVELGINYVDTGIGLECDVHDQAMARSVAARRDVPGSPEED